MNILGLDQYLDGTILSDGTILLIFDDELVSLGRLSHKSDHQALLKSLAVFRNADRNRLYAIYMLATGTISTLVRMRFTLYLLC